MAIKSSVILAMARHIQYCVEVLLKEIVHFSGIPHIYSFLWVVNAQTLTKDEKE